MRKNARLLSSSSLAGRHRNFPEVSEGPSSATMSSFVRRFGSSSSFSSIIHVWAGKLNGGSATASNVTCVPSRSVRYSIDESMAGSLEVGTKGKKDVRAEE